MQSEDSAPRTRRASIYDVAAAAGVSVSTVSRTMTKPDRVSFRTAEHVRKIAEQLGYRAEPTERVIDDAGTRLLAMVVADITNPVFFGMIRGAERTAAHAGYTLVLLETQESERAERTHLERVRPTVDGLILTSSRMSDSSIRALAKTAPLVVLNRIVAQVPSVAGDNVRGAKRAVEHLAERGHTTLSYLSGPEASWADAMRWRGVLEACHELGLKARRLGPFPPTITGGAVAGEVWAATPTTAVIAYNDLLAIGFLRAATATGRSIPGDVSVIGFDNIRDGQLIQPALTTISIPLPSLGSAAVNHLLKTRTLLTGRTTSVVLPARLVLRGTTGSTPSLR
jgi:LacI family transcriptional regulator